MNKKSRHQDNPDKKSLEAAILICGSQKKLAEKIGTKQQVVWSWLHRRIRIPAEFVIPIEKATNGEVSRHELRPDIYPLDDTAA